MLYSCYQNRQATVGSTSPPGQVVCTCNIQIYTTNATTTATIMSSMRIALSMYTALLTAAFGVDKKMLPENPLKHEMKLLKFEHNKLKNTQVDDKTYYNIIHLKT